MTCKDLKTIRLLTGRTQAQFATLLGVTEKTVSDWETQRSGIVNAHPSAILFIKHIGKNPDIYSLAKEETHELRPRRAIS